MVWFTNWQLLFIKRRCRLPRAELTRLFNRKYGTDYSVSQIHTLCSRRGWLTGRDGRFKKGHIPVNKGTRGLMKANSGSFKKGQVPANFKPVGSERIDVDGYVWVKVADPNKWKLKHQQLWERKNGPVPKGHVLRFIDHNPLNCSLDNLELMSRNLHCRLNKLKYEAADENEKPSLKLIAQIQSKFSRAHKEAA